MSQFISINFLAKFIILKFNSCLIFVSLTLLSKLKRIFNLTKFKNLSPKVTFFYIFKEWLKKVQRILTKIPNSKVLLLNPKTQKSLNLKPKRTNPNQKRCPQNQSLPSKNSSKWNQMKRGKQKHKRTKRVQNFPKSRRMVNLIQS